MQKREGDKKKIMKTNENVEYQQDKSNNTKKCRQH